MKRFILFCLTLCSLFLCLADNSELCANNAPAVNWPPKETTFNPVSLDTYIYDYQASSLDNGIGRKIPNVDSLSSIFWFEIFPIPRESNFERLIMPKKEKGNDYHILNDIESSKKKLDTDDVDLEKFAHKIKKFDRQLNTASKETGLPKKLIAAVINEESNWDPKAKSHKGAEGLMQLKKAAQKEVALKNPYNPDQNIKGGAQYLKKMCEMFDDNLELGVLAYKIGPDRLNREIKKKKHHRVSQKSMKYVNEIIFLSENV